MTQVSQYQKKNIHSHTSGILKLIKNKRYSLKINKYSPFEHSSSKIKLEYLEQP